MNDTTNTILLNNQCNIATMLMSDQNPTDNNINCNNFIYRNQDGTPTQATASIQHFQQATQTVTASTESGVRLQQQEITSICC